MAPGKQDVGLGQGLIFDNEVAGTAQQRIDTSDAISGKQRSRRSRIRDSWQFRGNGILTRAARVGRKGLSGCGSWIGVRRTKGLVEQRGQESRRG